MVVDGQVNDKLYVDDVVFVGSEGFQLVSYDYQIFQKDVIDLVVQSYFQSEIQK